MQLQIAPEAEDEIARSVEWYAERGERAVRGFVEELDGILEQARAHPMRWPIWRGEVRKVTFAHYPFSVFYRVRNDVVLIVAVAHAKRRPGYWLRRAR